MVTGLTSAWDTMLPLRFSHRAWRQWSTQLTAAIYAEGYRRACQSVSDW
jgi:hypothetical protein